MGVFYTEEMKKKDLKNLKERIPSDLSWLYSYANGLKAIELELDKESIPDDYRISSEYFDKVLKALDELAGEYVRINNKIILKEFVEKL